VKNLLSTGVAGLLASAAISTAQTIVVGNHVLIPNTPGQLVSIPVTGGAQVGALNLNAEIANGGVINGGTAGPAFTNFPGTGNEVDLITGTIFASNHTNQDNITAQAQVVSSSIATTSGTVSASGMLASFNIDTTGFSTAGSVYSLKLGGFSNGAISGNTDFGVDSTFNPIPANITNGNLIIAYPGDANLDGTVNFSDLVILAQHYNQTGQSWTTGDFDGDGVVNFSDLVLLAQNYGTVVNPPVPPSAAALQAVATVPEPASLGLLAFGAAFLCRRQRHRIC